MDCGEQLCDLACNKLFFKLYADWLDKMLHMCTALHRSSQRHVHINSAHRMCCVAQSPVYEPRYAGLRFVQLFLHLPSSIEDGAIPACAQDVLVQGALTPLALCPQVPIVRF